MKKDLIFEKLVGKEKNYLGRIAYTIYKESEIEFITQFQKANNDKLPNEKDLRNFHNYCNSDAFIKDITRKAEQVSQDFHKKNKYKAFWGGVLQIVLGSFLFVILEYV